MNSFEQLLSNTRDLYDEELKEQLRAFFCPNNLADYLISDDASQDDQEAIRQMFNREEPLLKRSLLIHREHPFCLEANYVIYCIGEDETVSDCFSELYFQKDNYADFDAYQKDCYLKILHFYGEFLLDIHSINKAINVVKQRAKLRGSYSMTDIDRLSYMYCLIENKEEFWQLYQENEFNEPLPYLLLISVLLKFDDEEKARDVLGDLIDRFYYASYIDHLWDLEDNQQEEAIEFKEAIDLSFEELSSVPHFFDWCQQNKQKVYRS